MANNTTDIRDIQAMREALAQGRRDTSDIERDIERACLHHPTENGSLVLIKWDPPFKKNKNKNDNKNDSNKNDGKNEDTDNNDEKVFKCAGRDGCGMVFCAAPYTNEQIEAMLFQLDSMIEQLKFNFNSWDTVPGGLANYYTAKSAIHYMAKTYRQMLSDMDSKVNNQKQKIPNRESIRGTTGVPRPYGNGRRY